MTEQDHPLRREPRPRVAVARGHVVEQAARRRQRPARDRVQILEPDGDAAEARRVAARELLVRARRGGTRVVLVHAHPRVDRLRIAVVTVRSVALADAREARLGELARRQRTPREEVGRLLHAEIGRLAHGAWYTPGGGDRGGDPGLTWR